MTHDKVNSPAHYNKGGIEVIDVIETYTKTDFRLANVLKYVCRCEYKGNKLEDLKKAQWYLNRVVDELAESQCFVVTNADRIAGTTPEMDFIKRSYYNYDPAEHSGAQCAFCGEAIRKGAVRLWRGDDVFCSYDCFEQAGEPEDFRIGGTE